MNKLKKIIGIMLILMLSLSMFVGCGAKQKTTDAKKASSKKSNDSQKQITLKMVSYNDLQYEYFTEIHNICEEYKKVKPYVSIEIEKFKDSEDFEKAIKIRHSADELPDLLPLKPYMLADFSNVMVSLNDTEMAKNNKYAEMYAVNGNIIGIPDRANHEFVYYHKSIFKKYNLKVPKTWNEFIATAKKIKEKGEYVPILLGAKDAWPDYPFNEFMPCLQAGDGNLWNVMAAQDEPFSKGKPFYEAYSKIKKLYDAKVFGKDPLGMGWDQCKTMFAAQKGAMLASGLWYLESYKKMGGDMNDLGLFLLPVRDNESDTFYATVMADGFWATPKNNENKEESLAFLEWFFSSDYYKEYTKAKSNVPTVKDINIDIPMLKEPFEGVDANFIVYDGGNKEFKEIINSFGFNVKKLGQEMLAGRDFEEMMNELNKNWKEARGN